MNEFSKFIKPLMVHKSNNMFKSLGPLNVKALWHSGRSRVLFSRIYKDFKSFKLRKENILWIIKVTETLKPIESHVFVRPSLFLWYNEHIISSLERIQSAFVRHLTTILSWRQAPRKSQSIIGEGEFVLRRLWFSPDSVVL